MTIAISGVLNNNNVVRDFDSRYSMITFLFFIFVDRLNEHASICLLFKKSM